MAVAKETWFVFWFQPILRAVGAATVPRVSVELLPSTRLPLALAVKPLEAVVTRPIDMVSTMAVSEAVSVRSRLPLVTPEPEDSKPMLSSVRFAVTAVAPLITKSPVLLGFALPMLTLPLTWRVLPPARSVKWLPSPV